MFLSGPCSSFVHLPLVCLSFCSTETVMDTRTATAELGWISFPANGWEEVSGYDENLNTIRTYQVCNVFEAAQRIYVEIRFTVRDCASIPSVLGSCKETFNLYYLETDRTVTEGVKGVEYWANAPFLKVDTIAADESFSQVDFGGRLMKVNTEVRSFGPLSKGKGFHLAFQDLGACMSLLAVRVFYKKCPSVVQNFAYFPETLTGAESTSLVIARGSCIPNAEEVDVPIKLYCNGDGEWMVPIGSCSCKAGYEPDNGNLCRACPQGTFKSTQGAGLCQQCPLYSRSTIEAATLCGCRNGYHRGDMDSPEDTCTSVPSAPRNLVSIVNQTSVVLEWHSPRDTGHRDDLSYNVICRRCHSPERRACQPCDDSVAFVPGKRGLRDTRVEISKLRAHTSYTFDVQAVNGVSNKSPYPAQQLSINITTNQAAPSVVPIMHQVSSTSRSFSLSWPPPEQPNGIILDYEIRYYDKVGSMMLSETTSVVLEGLMPGTGYVVQVRARTVAGYGVYSKEMLFQTLTDDEYKSELGQQLSLIAGSLVGGVCIVSLVAIAIICSRRPKESVYGDKLQQYNTGGEVTLRPDMFNGPTPTVTFPTLSDDPNEAVREFAKEIDSSCVKIEEVIGSGEFGEVYKGRLKPVGKKEIPVAIKTLKVGYSERQRRDFLSEASIMGQFDQPNIIRLEGVVTKSRPTMIITEFMENGALDFFLRQNDGQFPVIQLVGMLRGIASGMRYLAEMSYVHRDLAARNILVNSNLVCKVSDFGLSRYLEEDTSDPTYTSSLGGKIPVRWTAPEAIAYRKFTSASDVWSYGIVTWEVMSYGERPYWDMSNQDVINAIEQDFRLPAPMDCPVVLHQLMLDCWQKDRNARPKFPDIVSMLDKMIRNPASLKTGTNNIPPGPCIHPLLDRMAPDLSRVSSVEDWLAALKMTQYRDSFLGSGFTSLPLVTQITAEDLQRIGVSLAGHQKKILTSTGCASPSAMIRSLRIGLSVRKDLGKEASMLTIIATLA
uniref:receptor protein-tyrosine kinase n=1 Tax=Neogobius melanostomus TaxID=47308 RepID=A0A8C6V780_9GOBI